MTRSTGRDDDDELPRGWEFLVFGKVAEDLLEEDAPAANTGIPGTSASASACGAAASHEQQHNRPRKKERLNHGSSKPHMIFPDKIVHKPSNLSYKMDHYRRGCGLNTLPGEGTSTDTTLQRRNFFTGKASSSATANIGVGVVAAANPASPPPQNVQQEMTADQEGWRNVHRELGGSELVAIGEKTVTNSDRDMHQGRLLLTNNLTAEVCKQVSKTEKTKVYKQVSKTEKAEVYMQVCETEKLDGINSNVGLEVKVIDRAGRGYNMKCRYRESHRGMVFNGGWNNFLKNHEGLQDVAALSISAFRSREGKLCFVFLPRRRHDQRQ